MEWLNYHHLFYFWTVVREGSVSRAAGALRLAQPTVSTQIKQFEHALGESLLERQGRRVVATEVGRLVYRYADEIFLLGRELQETLKGRPTGGAMRLRVGVANAVPKLIVFQMLRPAMESATGIQVSCSEGQPDHLLAQLATHALDVVISDVPASPHLRVKVFSHLLGESGTTFFAVPALARRVRRGYPQSLQQVPMLLPTPTSALRRVARAMVRVDRRAASDRRRVRRLGPDEGLRPGRNRGVSGPDGDCPPDLPALRRGRRRQHRRGPGTLLRSVGRATGHAPRGHGTVGGGACRTVRRSLDPDRAALTASTFGYRAAAAGKPMNVLSSASGPTRPWIGARRATSSFNLTMLSCRLTANGLGTAGGGVLGAGVE